MLLIFSIPTCVNLCSCWHFCVFVCVSVFIYFFYLSSSSLNIFSAYPSFLSQSQSPSFHTSSRSLSLSLSFSLSLSLFLSSLCMYLCLCVCFYCFNSSFFFPSCTWQGLANEIKARKISGDLKVRKRIFCYSNSSRDFFSSHEGNTIADISPEIVETTFGFQK